MGETTLCPYCGAYSRRSCEYEEMTGMPRSCAPCEEDDEWDLPDPDLAARGTATEHSNAKH